jgi:hypothetical protein
MNKKIEKTSKFFTSEDTLKGSYLHDFEGEVVVVSESIVKNWKPEYQEKKYQLWKAHGGFGCDPNKIGTAVFAKCLVDGEEARFSRNDFVGIVKDSILKEMIQKGEVKDEN